ncbi:pyridoxal-phosphate dependent enzyme [Roseivirga echinicomitans]
MEFQISLAQLREAHERIKPFIHRTPIMTSQSLNAIAGCELYFKCENLQKIGAFKARGGLNAVLSIPEEKRATGVVTHSSGNHAQAVAMAAKTCGIPAYIVMPNNASSVKKSAVAGYGAQITYTEPTQAAREAAADKIMVETGATYISPYNDYKVIEGQGTSALEFLEDQPDLEMLVIPVGGGGLLAGTALSAHYLKPEIKIFGGEPEGAMDAYYSMQKGELVPNKITNTIADGLLVSLGDKTFAIIQKLVSEILVVSDKEIADAMRLIWERMKIVVEPSGAVPFAALLKNKEKFAGKKVGIILSGGNVDVSKLPF